MKKLFAVVKICWLVISGVVLAISLVGYDGKPNSDIEQFLVGSMIALSFPGGFLVLLVLNLAYALVDWCCGFTIGVSYPLLILEWVLMVAAGYLQWFILLPWLVRKWRARPAVSSPR